MNLRRRIAVSNALMVAIPVVATAAAALACALVLFKLAPIGGAFDDSADFEQASSAAVALAETALSAYELDNERDCAERLERLDDVLAKGEMGALVTKQGQDDPIHSFGLDDDESAANLAVAVERLGDGGLAQSDGRAVRLVVLEGRESSYDLLVFGNVKPSASYMQLKTGALLSAVIVLVVALLSAVVASRVLSRTVVSRMRVPLQELEGGLRALSAGDLSFRLGEPNDTEFASAYADFNDMAEALESSTRHLEEQDRIRRQLLADIAHDVRSPLTSIQGYAEGLIDGVAATPESRQRYLEVIRDKAEQIAALVGDLFELSKLDLEEAPISLEEVRLDCEVVALAKTVEFDVGALCDIALDFEPCYARIDRKLFARAVRNVLQNSVKFGAGHIAVSLARHEEWCVLSIADDGPGVAEDALPRLFDPFFREDASRSNTHEGSGLGLAFVKRAVEAMGGVCTVRLGSACGLIIEMKFPRTPRGGDA